MMCGSMSSFSAMWVATERRRSWITQGVIGARPRAARAALMRARDQGECGPAKHVPGSEPDAPDAVPAMRVTGAGTHTARGERSPGRHSPEVGAGCGKAARPDLCGGRAMKRTSLVRCRLLGEQTFAEQRGE